MSCDQVIPREEPKYTRMSDDASSSSSSSSSSGRCVSSLDLAFTYFYFYFGGPYVPKDINQATRFGRFVRSVAFDLHVYVRLPFARMPAGRSRREA